MRTLNFAAVLLLSLSVAGCFSDSSGPDEPRNTDSTGLIGILGPGFEVNTDFRANWQLDPAASIQVVPYPNDISGFLASPGTDGTLNLTPTATQPLAGFVNQLDGFSTNARITANFSEAVSAASLTPASVFVVEVALDRSTRAVIGLSDQTFGRILQGQSPFLVQGVEYEVGLAPDFDAGGQTVQIKPLKPLNGNRTFNLIDPATGQPTPIVVENGYLVILTNGITNGSGNAAVADTQYEQIKQGYLAGLIQIPDDPSQIDPDALTPEELIGLFTAAQLATAEALGIPVPNIVVTSSFTTLDTTVVMETVAAISGPGGIQLQPILTPVDLPDPTGQFPGGIIPAGTPVTTELIFALQGISDPTAASAYLYAGAMAGLPYYLTPAADPSDTSILTEYWEGAPNVNPLDPTSTVLSKFNPIPVANASLTVPLLATVPASAGPGSPPVIGGPIVIFAHGITRNRTDMLAISESFAAIGATVIAMDHALHGIAAAEIDFATITPEELAEILATTPLAVLRVPGVPERTFDVDLVTGGTPGTPPDGVIDPSGAHFINLSGPLVSRDNGRQSAADLMVLAMTVPTIDIAPPGFQPDGVPDYGASTVHFVSQSLGSIIGTTFLGSYGNASNIATATLGVGGGVISDLLLDSFSFGPVIEGGLSAAGLVPNTGVYNNYVRDLQNSIDAFDPISFASEAAAVHPVHFIEVTGDLVVPNSANNRLAAEMDVTEVTAAGANDVSGNSASRVCFIAGGHGSQLDPTDSPAATVEMQAETVTFGATLGGLLPIADPTVVGDFAAGDCQAPNRPRANTL
ncbi:MAG: hypothetical protein WBN65_02125 [Gammaproteobacteria bacterium]